MTTSVADLLKGQLFDFPGLAANPVGGFVYARNRDTWMQLRERDAEIAQGEAQMSLAILTIASEVNFAVLEQLDSTTQDKVLAVRAATPGALLAELAVRQMRTANPKKK